MLRIFTPLGGEALLTHVIHDVRNPVHPDAIVDGQNLSGLFGLGGALWRYYVTACDRDKRTGVSVIKFWCQLENGVCLCVCMCVWLCAWRIYRGGNVREQQKNRKEEQFSNVCSRRFAGAAVCIRVGHIPSVTEPHGEEEKYGEEQRDGKR